MSKICTWVGCAAHATHPQMATDGVVWADLCAVHDLALEQAMVAGVPQMLSAWVKAQGGAKKAAERF